MKNYNFCNNCGKIGHSYNQCNKPITSLGIIAFNKREGSLKYLLICRKDSLGYIEFLRGKYPLYNREYIQNLINEMTIDEKNRLLSKTFDELWKSLWGDYVGLQYRNEEKHSRDKFNQIKRGIHIYDEGSYDLEIMINESETNWETPEWGFPKGRRNYQEIWQKACQNQERKMLFECSFHALFMLFYCSFNARFTLVRKSLKGLQEINEKNMSKSF